MENTACCGEALFNTSAQFCCDGFLEEQEFENTECCAGQAYNRDEFICCQGNLLSVSILGRGESTIFFRVLLKVHHEKPQFFWENPNDNGFSRVSKLA